MRLEAISTETYDESLVDALYRLEIRHLARLSIAPNAPKISPAMLVAALAAHPDVRFQSALILVFLRRPDYQQHLAEAFEQLEPSDYLTLKLYYQAAVYLQRELAASLAAQPECRERLIDQFSHELLLWPAKRVPPGRLTAQPALEALGTLHQQHSGWQLNWAGFYRQQIPLFLKHLGTGHA